MENIFQRPPILMRLTMLTRDKMSLLRAASLRTAWETAHGLNDRKQRGWVEAGILPLNYSRPSANLLLTNFRRDPASLSRLSRLCCLPFSACSDTKTDNRDRVKMCPPRFPFCRRLIISNYILAQYCRADQARAARLPLRCRTL